MRRRFLPLGVIITNNEVVSPISPVNDPPGRIARDCEVSPRFWRGSLSVLKLARQDAALFDVFCSIDRVLRRKRSLNQMANGIECIEYSRMEPHLVDLGSRLSRIDDRQVLSYRGVFTAINAPRRHLSFSLSILHLSRSLFRYRSESIHYPGGGLFSPYRW